MTLDEGLDPRVYVDIGASVHMTNDPGNLANLVHFQGLDKVMIGDGSCHISHIGDCVKYKNIMLKDALVVPVIKKNLISVS